MIIRAKDQASRVITGLSRSASADFRRLQTAATLVAQRSAIDMAKVQQNYARQTLTQQKVLNNALQTGNTTRASAARQAIRDLGLMRQSEVLAIKQEQIMQREIMHTARRNAEAKAAVLESKREAARAAGQWVAVGAGMAIAGAVGIKALHSMAMGAVEYERQTALTLTQVDKHKTSIKELQGISDSVAKSVGVPLRELQPALYDIFSSMDVNIGQAKTLLGVFAKEAVAGQVSIQAASRATIGIMNAYHIPVERVNEVLDFQFQLVRKGVGTFEQFATTIGRAVPSAVRAGQSYHTLGAMMAFLTRNGISAAMAAASAGRALDAFANPAVARKFEDLGSVIKNESGLSADALRKLGIDTATTSVKITDAEGRFRNIVPVMGDLSAVLMKLPPASRAAVLKELFKGAGGTIQAMRYFNTVLPRFAQQNQLLRDMHNDSGAAGQAYAQMAATMASKTQVLKNQWSVFSNSLGKEAMPALIRLIDAGTKVLDWLNNLSPTQKRIIAEVLVFTSVVVALSGVLIGLAAAGKMVAAGFGIMQASVGGLSGALGAARVAAGGLLGTLGLLGAAAAAGAYHGNSLAQSYIKGERVGGLFAKQRAAILRWLGMEATVVGEAAGAHNKHTEVINENYRAMTAGQKAAEHLNERGIKPLTKSYEKAAPKIERVIALTEEQEKAFRDAAAEVVKGGMANMAQQQDRVADATKRLRDAQADLAAAQGKGAPTATQLSTAQERVHDATVRVERAQLALSDKTKDSRLEHIRLREAQHDLTRAQGAARGSNSKTVTSTDSVRNAVERVKEAQQALKEATGLTAEEVLRSWQDQIKAGRNWSKNMRTLIERGVDPAVVAELAKEGPLHIQKFVGKSKGFYRELNRAFHQSNANKLANNELIYLMMSGQIDKYVKNGKLDIRALVKAGAIDHASLAKTAGQKAEQTRRTHAQKMRAMELATRQAMIRAGVSVSGFATSANASFRRIRGIDRSIKFHSTFQPPKGFSVRDIVHFKAAQGGFIADQHKLIRRAAGGVIDRGSGPTSDDVLARVSKGEYVVNARATAQHRELLDSINRSGLPGYATGGFVNPSVRTASMPRVAAHVRRVLASVARQVDEGIERNFKLLLPIPELSGSGGGSARGLVGNALRAFSIFRKAFPGMVIGGWRARGSVPGSDHPKGLALDLMTTSRALHHMIIDMGKRMAGAKYWISYRQIGHARDRFRPRYYGGPSPHTDHVHWSFYDKGGLLRPGRTMAINRTGQSELVLPLAKLGKVFRDSLQSFATGGLVGSSRSRPVPAGAIPYAKHLLQRIRSQAPLFEDFTWRGMPRGYGRWNDDIQRLVLPLILGRYDFPRDLKKVGPILGRLIHQSRPTKIERSVEAIKNFIRMADKLPYRRGAAGPDAYDCSGLVGEVWNRITGNKSYVRRWTAQGSPQGPPMHFLWMGREGDHWKEQTLNGGYRIMKNRPRHAFTVGLSMNLGRGGHTVGNFMGLNFEAANPRAGIRIGGAANGPWNLPWQYYLAAADRKYKFDRGGWLMPGTTLAVNNTGRPERVSAPGEPSITVNINGPVYGANADQLADQIQQALLRKKRRNGGVKLGLT
jgi:TP901 family phage tail tape measure protein